MIRDWRYSSDPNQGETVIGEPCMAHPVYMKVFCALEYAGLMRVTDARLDILTAGRPSYEIEVSQERARRARL